MKTIKTRLEKRHRKLSLKAFAEVYRAGETSGIPYWIAGIIGLLILILFLPWTQTIRSSGIVTTLRQEHRRQEIHSMIGGKVSRWLVKEGDLVTEGDTLVVLTEIKDQYLDPRLLDRTRQQIGAKQSSIKAYQEKIAASSAQIDAIQAGLRLKLIQLRNKIDQTRRKIISDSFEALAAENDFNIAEAQYRRQRIMRDSGLASLAQVEQKLQYYQSAIAKRTSAEIKLSNARTDLVNLRIEQGSATQEYAEKTSKTRGERASAQSDRAGGEAELSKLENQYSNYLIRSGQYYILAPQSGQVVSASKSGLNEIIKEGEKLLEIIPTHSTHAVEIFIRPVDRPLIQRGQVITFSFDGYPAIVFSGWPAASYGTFKGRVIFVESGVSDNGKFRALVAEDPHLRPWPPTLSRGTGAQAIALLKDVPIGYELWRNINGFPPDFYVPDASDKKGYDKKSAK